MPEQPSLSLVVIRVSDITRSAEAYSVLGMTFQQEQHGNGPVHCSGAVGGTILELYPATERSPVTSCRLGFAVACVDDVIAKWRESGGEINVEPTDSPSGRRAVVTDPDGHKIELTQR
ncbi:MAG TPA: VOC family protein [Schlesneria sp.]|jgi:predicted enzyme related to lactoylglutathione lyase